jgi:hypothetical protein
MAKNEWSNNNLADIYTWFNLKQLNQHSEDFDSSQKLTIKQLAFYNELASAEAKRLAAEALAIPLVNLYQSIGKADFEKGMTKAKAKNALIEILVDGKKTIVELATVADDCFHFPNEGDNK